MNTLDWIVLIITLTGIVGYGVWKTRGKQDVESYLMGDRQQKWWTIEENKIGQRGVPP